MFLQCASGNGVKCYMPKFQRVWPDNFQTERPFGATLKWTLGPKQFCGDFQKERVALVVAQWIGHVPSFAVLTTLRLGGESLTSATLLHTLASATLHSRHVMTHYAAGEKIRLRYVERVQLGFVHELLRYL